MKGNAAQKVVKVEKRILDAQRDPAFSTSAVFMFWASSAVVCLFLAVFSFFITDIDARLADSARPVDAITTAGISGAGADSFNIVQRRKQTAEADIQKQKIDDIARVIHRLRSEQTSLNNRLAELDGVLTHTRERTGALEKEFSKILVRGKDTLTGPDLAKPSAKLNLNPENTENLLPRPVRTSRVTDSDIPPVRDVLAAQPSSSGAPPLQQTATAGTSIVSKTKPSTGQSVDETVVGSIDRSVERVEKSRFAVDLGVNSTPGQAETLWNDLRQQQPEAFKDLTAHYIPTGGEGETRLIAGPFPDASDAIRVCVLLRASESFCKTTLYPQ